jgi:hypothetical protein
MTGGHVLGRHKAKGARPAAHTAGPTEILLAVFLSLAIFLGWLQQDGAVKHARLKGKAAESERKAEDRKKEIDEIEKSAAGSGWKLYHFSLHEVQRYALLSAWEAYKTERGLRKLLIRLDDARRIRRAGRDRGFLPDDPEFSTLVSESNRIFGAATEPDLVSRAEVRALIAEVWSRVGTLAPLDQAGRLASAEATDRAFARARGTGGTAATVTTSAAAPGSDPLGFRPETPTVENLTALAEAIRHTLEDERRQVAALQFAVESVICSERILHPPDPEKGLPDAEATRRDLVRELKVPLGLLPEVERTLLKSR